MFDHDIITESIQVLCREDNITLTTDSMVLCFRNNERSSIYILPSDVQAILDDELPRIEGAATLQNTVLNTQQFLFYIAVFMEGENPDIEKALLFTALWSAYYQKEHNLDYRPIVLCISVKESPMVTDTIANTRLLTQ